MNITFRPTTLNDTYALFQVFLESVTDLGKRLGAMAITDGHNPEVITTLWESRRSLWEHLQRSSEESWLAELDGQVIGYARSILRGEVRELTEFFVLPNQQAAGVGRELLMRAFPRERVKQRFLVATLDPRALGRYFKAGVQVQFPVCHLSRKPEAMPLESDLVFESVDAASEPLEHLGMIDQAILGYRRHVDHQWLLENRQGLFYRRNGRVVGYGYIGKNSGPFALLEARDFPAVLAHAEQQAALNDYYFGVEIPMINHIAVQFLTGRGYQLDNFFEFFMSDTPFGNFENYIFTSPPIFA